MALFSIFGRSDPYGIPTIQMYGFLWVILVSFIISHWEKYNTGILFLPWSYDLSQLVITHIYSTFIHSWHIINSRFSFQGYDIFVHHDISPRTKCLVLYGVWHYVYPSRRYSCLQFDIDYLFLCLFELSFFTLVAFFKACAIGLSVPFTIYNMYK